MGERKVRKKKNIALRVIAGILIALVLVVGIYFLYVFRTYHRIADKQNLDVTKGSTAEACAVGKEYNVISYNIGFGAYTPDFSFFMDGGKSSWAESKESVIETVTGAAELVRNLDPEIVMFQEIDTDGTRSYHVDQKKLIDRTLPEYTTVSAVN